MKIYKNAQSAIKVIRSREDELNINPDRLFMLGFSAGGDAGGIRQVNKNSRVWSSLARD